MEARDLSNIHNKSFLRNKSEYKYIELWTKKIYRHINYVMREKNEKILHYPYTLTYIKKIIENFYNFGHTIKDLKDLHVGVLYRGLDNSFCKKYIDTNIYYDSSFIATSSSKEIAQMFKIDETSIILHIDINSIQSNTPIIILDNIIPYEHEVLLLPGIIELVENNNKTILGHYKMNTKIVQEYQSIPYPDLLLASAGGSIDDEPDVNMNLCEKRVVWYRAPYNRNVDVLSSIEIPCKTEDESIVFFNDTIRRYDAKMEKMMNVIPEIIDLENSTDDVFLKKMSYYPLMAVYDPYLHVVKHIHYGIDTNMFKELHPIAFSKQNLVVDAILKDMIFWHNLRTRRTNL